MSDLTLNDVTANLEEEVVPSLADFEEEVGGGAWKAGWYPAEIIEGYATPKGKQFITDDGPSQKGDSRNARFCLRVSDPASKQERTTFYSINYRESDFGADRMAYVKQARSEHKGVQGRWNDDPDAQRSSLALVGIANLEKALGFSLRTKDGRITPVRAIGQKLDIRFSVNKDGFNDVTGTEKSGTKAKR